MCAFNAKNLKPVGIAIKNKYPNARILFLSDNDRHLVAKGSENEGLEASRITSNNLGATSSWVAPDFSNLEPLKEFSDWNDLARVRGISEVRRQIKAHLDSLQ